MPRCRRSRRSCPSRSPCRCERVRVLIVSGIWPPDVGGPATHAPEVAEFLRARGHDVEVLTTAAAEPAPRPYPVHWVPRRLPAAGRYARGALLAARAARRADVVYSTGMIGRTRVGALLGRAPRVVKLTGDPAYERALRYGLTTLPLDAFQRAGGARIAALKAVRSVAMSGARLYVCPSESLRRIASRLGPRPARAALRVLPNPVAVPRARRPRGAAPPPRLHRGRRSSPRAGWCRRRRSRSRSRRCGSARALRSCSPATGRSGRGWRSWRGDCRCASSARSRGRPSSSCSPPPDAVLLSSTWENFPHAVVEGLAVGDAGDRHGGRRGDGDRRGRRERAARAAAGPGRARRGDPPLLRGRGAAGAPPRAAAAGSVAGYAPERIYEQLESLLLEAAR